MKRAFLGVALALCASLGAAQQAWPARSVTLVVPFPPGGGTDTGARLIADQLSKKWGQPVVVENKAGAAGMVGATQVAQARPDGYTLLVGNIGTQAINPSLYTKMSYDPDKAFAPVSLIAKLPLTMVVNPAVPAQSVQEFIALAKSQPGKLSYSSSGAGGSPHLAAEMFKDASGTDILHVAYRGGGPAVADLLAGHVQLSFVTVLEASGHIQSGKLRALAVTSEERVPSHPNLPTLAESGLPNFNSVSWIGLLAPAGTPQPVLEKISTDMRELLTQPEVKKRLQDQGAMPQAMAPAEFAALIDSDRRRYARIIRDRGISTE